VTVEEKHPEVRSLITLGKERGYLLYDEIYQALPEELANAPEELDEIYIRFGDFGIEVVDVPEKATQKKAPGTPAATEPVAPDPSLVEKTNDPVRMYLREMGTVPLLTREGEVAIAKRIERGKLAVIKSISRTPTIAKRMLIMGDQLRAGQRTVRELVIFSDEEITDEVIEDRKVEVLGQIEEVRKALKLGFDEAPAGVPAAPTAAPAAA